jgi:hypothetical protein
MLRSRRAAATAVAVVLAVSMPSAAVEPISPQDPTPVAHGKRLSAAHPVLTFAGQMHNPTPLPTVSNPDPTVCVSECQLWALHVNTKHRFLVSVHNGSESIDDGFNLYVYDPSGAEVARAGGIGSNGQAAVVTPTGAGVYTVAVTVTYAYDANAKYLGEARVMARPSWHVPRCRGEHPCTELPALKVRPPTDVHVEGVPPVASTPLGFPFPVNAGTPNSCYLDETFRTGATRCLRFTSDVGNVGTGPLTLQIPWAAASSDGATAAALPGQCEATQVIVRTDGTARRHDAGGCEFHAQHGHFHYLNFVEFSLHKVDPDGTAGKQVAASLKESFCLADDGYFGFATAGPNGPRTYVGQPDCNVPSAPTPSPPDAWITMGLTPGWSDIYTWDTPDQFIDISDTPPGVYDIESRANPAGALVLSGPVSSCAATRIKLTDSAVKVLDPDVPCG